MKTKGIIRKLDELGRIVIPKEMRTKLDVDVGTPLEIHLEGDTIIIKKDTNTCIFCQSEEGIDFFKDKPICSSCLGELRS